MTDRDIDNRQGREAELPGEDPDQTGTPDAAGEADDVLEADKEVSFTGPAEGGPETGAAPLQGGSPADELAPVDTSDPGDSEAPDSVQAIAGGDLSPAEGPAARDEGDADADTETLEAPEGMGEPEVTTERVVEAVLFASDAPLPLSKIVSVLGVGSARDVRGHIKALNEKYERTGASFRIEQIASGYQMLTLPVYNTWIRRLKQSKQDSRLSQAAMETLAVVAYKQPVVRADIEAIRGVSGGEMLNRLRELGLIKIVGRAEDVGRPMLYGTTRRFLEVFGLSGLEDLPSVEEMQPGQQ
jgi:segregation and condensation protein B